MLNLETTSIEILEESYKISQSSSKILSIVLAITAVVIIIGLIYSEFEGLLRFIFVVIASVCLSVSLVSFTQGSAPYYEITAEVEPTEELTVEKLKNNDNFIENDYKIYFKTKLNKYYIQSVNSFNNKEALEKEINEKFEDAVGKIWIEDKKVK